VRQSLEANSAYATQFNVVFELLQDGDDAIVSVDSLRLEQVLANYLSNAAKFSPPNEIVNVQVERQFGYVRVTVSDKGKGIPEEFRNRIFQKFSQADSSDTRQKGGTGLGLAICKEIIERMGGKVGFDSQPGHGAAFYFELPCEDHTQKRPLSEVEPERPHRRLLIVEDDASIALIWESLLHNAGYECDLASTAKAAQEYLALRHYDLMTLDLQLPDMDGIDLLCQIRKQELLGEQPLCHLPVLMVSVDADIGKLRYPQHLPKENIRWLQKPLDNHALLKAVAELLGDESSSSKGQTL
jgi:CheY-like chemotaxis protein/anti-sigma regulatory factor (Ser/Thr protein kinase)